MHLSLKIFIIILVYIIIVTLQYKFYQKKNKKYEEKIKKTENEIKFNKENSKELDNLFYQELSKRRDLLKTMSYQDWINYNQKNIEIEYKGRKYYTSIWKKIDNMDRFILKTYYYDEYLHDDRDNLLERIEAQYVYNRKHKPSKDILKMIYNMNEQPYGKFSHFWIYKEFDDQIRKTSISLNYDDGKNNKGVILCSYMTLNVSEKYTTDYFKIAKKTIFYMSLFTLIISIILLIINKNTNFNLLKSIIFMVILNIYIFIFIMKNEKDRSTEGEMKKEESINSGILSVSFLVGVNIFIVGKIGKENNNTFFLESILLFILVLICLLISTLKNTNHNSIQDITKKRLQKELFFNISVLINIFIIINFGFYIFFGKNRSK